MKKIDEQEFIQICETVVSLGKIDPESYWESVYLRVCSWLEVDASRIPIAGEENAPPGSAHVWNLSMKIRNRKRGNFDTSAIGSKILNDART